MSGKHLSPSPLVAAIRSGSLLAVSNALDDGAHIEEADMHGQPGLPLRTACFSGNLEIVGELIRRGANINAPGNDGPGMPLRLAQRAGHPAVITLLIQHGAEVPPDLPVDPQLRFNTAHLELLPLDAPAPELPVASAAEAETEHFNILEDIDIPASYGTATNLLSRELLRFNESNETAATLPGHQRLEF